MKAVRRSRTVVVTLSVGEARALLLWVAFAQLNYAAARCFANLLRAVVSSEVGEEQTVETADLSREDLPKR